MVPVASVLSGRLMARTGPRTPMIAGLALGGPGLLGWLAACSRTSYLLLAGPLMATGFGMALTMPAATAAVMGSAPAGRAGLASGVVNTARQVGGVIGVALLGTLVGHRGGFVAGMHVSAAVSGAAFLAGCGLTAVVGDRRREGRRPAT
jgi:DHA2 family methylenomycin A resistance protein-like MFS transporter